MFPQRGDSVLKRYGLAKRAQTPHLLSLLQVAALGSQQGAPLTAGQRGRAGPGSVQEALAGLLPPAGRAPQLPTLHAVHLPALLGVPAGPPGDTQGPWCAGRPAAPSGACPGPSAPTHLRLALSWQGRAGTQVLTSGGARQPWGETQPELGAPPGHTDHPPLPPVVSRTWWAGSLRPAWEGAAAVSTGGGGSGRRRVGGTEAVGDAGARLDSPRASTSTPMSSSV